MRILEVTEFDLYGRGFNGYDIMKRINRDTDDTVKMAALRKVSDDPDVIPVLKKEKDIRLCDEMRGQENGALNMMSVLSLSSPALYRMKEYREADVVHYHQFHNSDFGFFELEEEAKRKPTVISFHDPWMMTGRCVHPRECRGYVDGCGRCGRLDTLFGFKKDNSAAMWKIKRDMFRLADPDVIVHSDYMYRLTKENPYTRDLNVHLIPFGVDVESFSPPQTKDESRERLGIPKDDFVLFFRAQADFKGTNYIVDALKMFDNTEGITLLTCSQSGLLGEISDRYNIIELGNVQREDIVQCFNACDVFLMPSIGESFGMMALEAMAAGRPVVVFDNTALPQVTHAPDVGVLVQNLDSADLYRKIKYLMDNEQERAVRGQRGRELAKAEYSLDRYNAQMSEVYKTAYERQKYKLTSERKKIAYSFDGNDREAGKIVYHLEGIFARVFREDGRPIRLFKDVKPLECGADEIDYENSSVKKAVLAFNEQCYCLMLSKKLFFRFKRKVKTVLQRVFGVLKRMLGRAA